MNREKRTKIVATLGPAISEKSVLKELIEKGVNVFRINFSHGDLSQHQESINLVRELNAEMGTAVALLGDLQGPKIRIGIIENGEMPIAVGDELTFSTKLGVKGCIDIQYPEFAQDVSPGDQILLDDGKIEMEVLSTDGKEKVVLRVTHGEVLKSRKGVNLPNTKISQPSLTAKDLKDLDFIMEQDLDWVALSFVRSARDIIEVKHILSENKVQMGVISKIEKPEAISDLDAIIQASDAVMIARGDLGVEVPMQKLPLLQKEIIKQSRNYAKPVIVATQMMESMIENVTPTRAEVNDVANAVLDGADAVMLSGETSVGKFPIKVIEAMDKIIREMETSEDIYNHETPPNDLAGDRFITDSICYNACRLVSRVHAKAVATMTHSGYTALKISSQRPKTTVFVFTGNPKLLTKLSLAWGVKAFFYDRFLSTDHTIADIKYILKKEGGLEDGDMVINLASMPIGEKGMTNMIKLSYV
ncbi:MAG: pyruvate kinase [Sphingobacteriales bacterium]|jgi:pyruvate kinase